MREKKMKYVFFEGDAETGKIIMNDLIKKSNVKIIYRDNALNSKLLSKLFNIHMSQLLNRHIKLPFKKLWFKRLIDNSFSKNDTIAFTFIAGWFDIELLSWLRKNYPHCKQILFLRDTVNLYEKAILSFQGNILNNLFDLVISSNPTDCSKYGFKYSPVFISKFEEDNLVKYPESDFVFIAVAKDRLQLIHKLYEKFTESGFKCDFHITNVKDENKKYSDGINYSKKHLKYKDYLGRVVSSHCIIELVKGDTQGGTYRHWEAVYYNKKLITNWKGIKDFEFYDERYMMYFENVEEIDINFFKENLNVEYHYKGENSPVNLLEFIETNS